MKSIFASKDVRLSAEQTTSVYYQLLTIFVLNPLLEFIYKRYGWGFYQKKEMIQK